MGSCLMQIQAVVCTAHGQRSRCRQFCVLQQHMGGGAVLDYGFLNVD